MIRRLLPWAIIGLLAAIAFFVGSTFWRASQLPENLTATATDTVEAPVAAVWLVLNTPGVLKERFDEVEFQEVVEDAQGLSSWTSRHEDRNYFTRYVRTQAEQPGGGQAWVYAYTITPEEVPVLTTREVRMTDTGNGFTEVQVTDSMTVTDRQMRMWMGVLGIDSGAKNELKAIMALADAAEAAL